MLSNGSVTSARIKGELSNAAEAYTKELNAMFGKNPRAIASRKDNTAGKRVKDAIAAYKDASKSGGDLKTATNTLSNAMDTLLVEAADRATWSLRHSANRKAGWSPTMAKHTAALKFLQKSQRWQIPCLRIQLSELRQEQQDELPSPWERDRALKDPIGARNAWLKDTREAQKKIRYALSEASKRHDRACINSNTTAREHAHRLGRTGRIFRELLGARRANRK